MNAVRNAAKFLILAAFVLGFAASASAQVTWTFSDVSFTNGDAVTGSFTTDSGVTMVESFNVTITGPQAFTVAGLVDSYLPGEIGIFNAGFSQYIDLYLSSNMTGAGGTIPITSAFDCPGCGTLNGASPEIIGVTPEPSTAGLMLIGVGLLMGTWFVRRGRRPIATNS